MRACVCEGYTSIKYLNYREHNGFTIIKLKIIENISTIVI